MRIGRLTMHLRDIALEHDPEDGDTIESIIAYLRENKEHYKEFYHLSDEIVDKNADIPETADISDVAESSPAPAEKPIARRGRKPKNQPDPATAVAPPPLAVPLANPSVAPGPAAPAPVTSGDPGPIPAFLDRNAPAPVAVAPPPPPPAPAPVAPPPSGVLGAKIVAELEKRKAASIDEGKGLLEWLGPGTPSQRGIGLTVAKCDWQKAMDCVLFTADEKLAHVAPLLGVA